MRSQIPLPLIALVVACSQSATAPASPLTPYTPAPPTTVALQSNATSVNVLVELGPVHSIPANVTPGVIWLGPGTDRQSYCYRVQPGDVVNLGLNTEVAVERQDTVIGDYSYPDILPDTLWLITSAHLRLTVTADLHVLLDTASTSCQ